MKGSFFIVWFFSVLKRGHGRWWLGMFVEENLNTCILLESSLLFNRLNKSKLFTILGASKLI